MNPTFNYRSEWKRMRGPWGINWNTMVSKENGDAVTSPAPMPVNAPVTPAPVQFVQSAPRQAPPMAPLAEAATLGDLLSGQQNQLDELDGADGGRAYNQGVIEASKSQAEALRAAAMAEYLKKLTPIDYSAAVNYPDRPVRAPMTPFVAPEVPINPWAAGFAALAGLVDPNAAAPATHSLLDATVNRQELVRQQAQQAWQQALADQNQRYEDSLAGYGQDVARASSARDLALKAAIAQRQDDIERYRLETEGKNPLISDAASKAMDKAADNASKRETILSKMKATEIRYNAALRRAALETTEAGKTGRAGIVANSAKTLAQMRIEGDRDRAILNNRASMAELTRRLDAQQRISNAEIASRERMNAATVAASRYATDARGLAGGGMTDQQKAKVAALAEAYNIAARNYQTIVGSSDITWSGTVKEQAAAALAEMLAKEKAHNDYVEGIQAPAQPVTPAPVNFTARAFQQGAVTRGGGGGRRPNPKAKPKTGGGSSDLAAMLAPFLKK